MTKKRMMLFFGSFNPVHNGHMALAEYAVERGLCDEVAMIISPQNPFKQSMDLAAEMDRYSMVEAACKNSRYPEQINPSIIEFLLEKPSYTINTLRHLTENYGDAMEFTILMGSDLINTLPKWREAEEIMAGYDIYVYPRPNVPMTFSTDRTTFLADAPQCAYSSTEVRDRLERGDDVSQMIDKEVREYIRGRGLWTLAGKITSLTAAISQTPEKAELYLERGKCYFRKNEWGNAINDFRKAEELAEDKTEARQYIEMAEEILEYRYKDIYNP